MINTIHGEMDETQPDPQTGIMLEKREGTFDNEDESGNFVEYWQCIHRSASTNLKRGLLAEMFAGQVGS